MKNSDLLSEKIEDAIKFLTEQDEKLKPLYEMLTEALLQSSDLKSLPFNTKLEAFCRIQEQYTNCTLLLTKMKEIIDYNEY